jgi:hypothetical protein
MFQTEVRKLAAKLDRRNAINARWGCYIDLNKKPSLLTRGEKT